MIREYKVNDFVYVARSSYEAEIGIAGTVIATIGTRHYEVELLPPWDGAEKDIADWQQFVIVSCEAMTPAERG